MDVQKPLYRGMKNTDGGAFIIEGEKGTRVGTHDTNHYTLIIDHMLKQGNHPLRSKATIVTNNRTVANTYGTLFAIFPYDDVQIGMLPTSDLWNVDIRIGTKRYPLIGLSDFFAKYSKNPKTYDDIVDDLSKILEKERDSIEDYDEKNLYKMFYDDYLAMKIMPFSKADKKDVVDKVLIQAFDPDKAMNVKFGTLDQLDITNSHEFWFSGKCVAIELEEYKELLKDGAFE